MCKVIKIKYQLNSDKYIYNFEINGFEVGTS